MQTNQRIEGEYFNWLSDVVTKNRYSRGNSYSKLLSHLHNTEFTYLIDMDENRVSDGLDLRRRFALYVSNDHNVGRYLGKPCSVLEMMVGLAMRCEETIMDDPRKGDRTGQWFWSMIVSLGLGSMVDYSYDANEVNDILRRFLNREYQPNGKGGLFTLRHCEYDLTIVEIWTQLNWYLDTMT